MEYYSAVKESGILPFVATWVDLESHAERSESQKDKHHVISLTRGTLKKVYRNELIYETEADSQI